MKSFILTIFAFVFLLIPPAEATIFVKKGQLLNHSQFMRLNAQQKIRYVKGMRNVFIKLAKSSKKYAELESTINFENLFDLLIPRGYADDDDDLSCMYAGFVIVNDKCGPKTATALVGGDMPNLFITDAYCANEEKPALCNPLLFGMGSGGTGHCVARSKNATEVCRNETKDEIPSIVDFIEKHKEAWDVFLDHFDGLCGTESKIKPEVKARPAAMSDIRQTCKWAGERIASIWEEQDFRDDSAGEKVEVTDDKAEQSVVGRKFCPPGPCEVIHEDANMQSFSGKVKSFNEKVYKHTDCSAEVTSVAGRASVEIKNAPRGFPLRELGGTYKFDEKICEKSDCKSELVQFGKDDYMLKIEPGDKSGEACKIRFVRRYENVDVQTYNKQLDNTELCMGDPKEKNTADKVISDLYKHITDLVASNKCDFDSLTVFRDKKSELRTSTTTSITCRARIASSVNEDGPIKIRVKRLSGGTDYREFANANEAIAALSVSKLKNQDYCFNSVEARVASDPGRNWWGVKKKRSRGNR